MIIQFPKKELPKGEIFDFYADQSHGWLHVPWTVLLDLKINPYLFSNFSYADETGAFLEEDLDLLRFENLFRAKTGKRIVFHDVTDDQGFVRSKLALHKFLTLWSHMKGEEKWK